MSAGATFHAINSKRKVEGDDCRDDAVRLLHREVDLVRQDGRHRVPPASPTHFGVIVEAGRNPVDAVHRFDERFAGLPRHQRGELALPSANLRGDVVQVLGLLHARGLPPGVLGPSRRLHRGVHIGGTRVGGGVEQLERCGIPDLAGSGAVCRHPGAVDEERLWHGARSYGSATPAATRQEGAIDWVP